MGAMGAPGNSSTAARGVMRWLIDGYNLMHAAGAMNARFVGARFHLARKRFLNRMAAALGPLVHETTVVFDASHPPAGFPVESTYKGITIIFAVADDDADSRIERMIVEHPNPKTLTVVSSDHRVQRAAKRRKARAVGADDYLDHLQTLRYEQPRPAPPRREKEEADLKSREIALSAEEAADWERVFGSIDDDPEVQKAFETPATLITDADIARIKREVDREPVVRPPLKPRAQFLTDADIARIQREVDLED